MKPFAILVGGLAVLGILSTPASAQNLRKYHDKAAFLADTAAGSFFGPVPDVGMFIREGDWPTELGGGLVFSLAPGGDYIAVGARNTAAAPDWYPGTPGHDIAMGWEHFQINTYHPIHSFGFDIVEPRDTMPPWGGVPVESTYDFLLFLGATFVGRVQFEGSAIPNDIQTFIGVWSDRPFDRVIVNDFSGDDDDEYFGEFYGGVTPYGCTMNLDLAYGGGQLTMWVGVATTIPRTWNMWAVYGASWMVPILSAPLPAISPEYTLSFDFPVPPIGSVGFLSTLQSDAEGIACSTFKTLDTNQ